MRRLAILLFASAALLLPAFGSATTGPIAVHYLLASGTPGPFQAGLGCIHVASAPLGGGTLMPGTPGVERGLPQAQTPETYAGGACLVVGTGTHAVRVVDDLGASPAYWYALSLPGPDGRNAKTCAYGQAQGEIVLASDECTQLEVLPVAGSAAGTIFVS